VSEGDAKPHFEARCWCFGDDINTDLLMPGAAMFMKPQEAARTVFQAHRPGWMDEVKPGDILIAGRNFGMGSSRPAARSLKILGLAAVVADTVNGLFFRNCVNFGLPVMECPGVRAAFEEGDTALVDFNTFTVQNARTSALLKGVPYPDSLWAMLASGGPTAVLRREGYIA
jgi:3-isopropylmalate/(R)-2-methylmalate dehydratase small subunit